MHMFLGCCHLVLQANLRRHRAIRCVHRPRQHPRAVKRKSGARLFRLIWKSAKNGLASKREDGSLASLVALGSPPMPRVCSQFSFAMASSSRIRFLRAFGLT